MSLEASNNPSSKNDSNVSENDSSDSTGNKEDDCVDKKDDCAKTVCGASDNTLLEVYKLHSTHSHSLTQTRNAVGFGFMTFHVIILRFGGDPLFYLLGILVSIAWLKYINSYQKLNSAKIKILMCLEKRLGFNFYNKEYDLAKREGYTPLTILDKGVAWGAIAVYAMLIAFEAAILYARLLPYLDYHL